MPTVFPVPRINTKLRRLMERRSISALCGLALLLVLVSPGRAADILRIRIGVEDNAPPLSFANREGQPAGFTTELLREAGRAGGIDFEIVTGPWLSISSEFAAEIGRAHV